MTNWLLTPTLLLLISEQIERQSAVRRLPKITLATCWLLAIPFNLDGSTLAADNDLSLTAEAERTFSKEVEARWFFPAAATDGVPPKLNVDTECDWPNMVVAKRQTDQSVI